MQLSIVTGNPGKYKQIVSALPDFLIPTQVNLDIPEIQTNLITHISKDKCRQAFEQVGGPVLVDDSGIFFDAYENFPGAFSKYVYQGLGFEGLERLFLGQPNRGATFQCVVSYMDETLSEPVQFVGETKGKITFDNVTEKLKNTYAGLPYDAIFLPEFMNCIAADDMTLYKGPQHHRSRAVMEFGGWVKEK